MVVAAAIVRDGKVLAQERAYPTEAAGLWELPGGRVEPGESDVDAVARECQEELGCTVIAKEPVGPDVPLSDHMVLRTYTATLTAGEPEANDHRTTRWLENDALSTVPWLPADRILLPHLSRIL
nr:(deoxy)nucleoside triphosphate pyrophosphohydrolase [Actinokineospora sp. NBRC 105648]